MLEKYLIGISLFTQGHNTLALLGNCSEDYEGQWFTCIKFVGKMNSSSCTKTCSQYNLISQFGLNDFYYFSDGLRYFLKPLNLTSLENQLNVGHPEWSILEYAGTLNSECNICTNVYYNFNDKEWTDGKIGLKNEDFVRNWKNKFQNVWYQSRKDRYAIEPYQPDAVVLLRRVFKLVP